MSSDSAENNIPITKEDVLKSKIFVSSPIQLRIPRPDRINYVELEFEKLDISKESCEARIFLNNTNANHETEKTLENGYVASLFVFGHGSTCYGGPGHCEVDNRDNPYDIRPDHPLKPQDEFLNITEGFKKIFQKGNPITVTIVPILRSRDKMTDLVSVLKFGKPHIHVYCK